MSIARDIEVSCPSCGFDQEADRVVVRQRHH